MSDLTSSAKNIHKPSDLQRQMLCEMLGRAFVQIRMLCWQGMTEQAGALSDALHNLPFYLHSSEFDWGFFRSGFLEPYHNKYPPLPDSEFDYLSLLDEIEKVE